VPELILEGDGDLGFEEAFLLLLGGLAISP
jgi:hypothetical protein